MARVIIGVDPHKRSATIEVINEREQTLGQGRFGTDRDCYKTMITAPAASTAGAVIVVRRGGLRPRSGPCEAAW